MEQSLSTRSVYNQIAGAPLLILGYDFSEHVLRGRGKVSFLGAAVIFLALPIQLRLLKVSFFLELNDFLGSYTYLEVI